jgi:DNA-binding IclR family transcriptional regulator
LEVLTETSAARPVRLKQLGGGITLPDRGLVDGLECLEAVVAAGRPVSPQEVAESLGIGAAQASRLIGTLGHLGLVECAGDDTYRPGSAVHRLAALSLRASPLLEVALPYAKRWWEDGFAVTVGVLYKQDICLLLHARPEWPFERAVAGHELWPASWSTAGVALLAAKAEAETDGLVQPGRPHWVDPNEPLERVLAATRQNGYARRDLRGGCTALGVTIGEPAFAGLAVSRAGITEAVRDNVIACLKETAAVIAEQTRSSAARDGA